MPRSARVKSKNSILHVMVRSIKEVNLFNDNEDKIKYFSIIKKYQLKHGFYIYAYCLMNNHGHLLVDCAGSDISKVMHSINLSYARYYNRKYKRYGHVFQDRFKSKPVRNYSYFVTLSAYIHNNPKDIVGYENCIENYPFSSLKDYINKTNSFGILNKNTLATLLNLYQKDNLTSYLNLVKKSSNQIEINNIEFLNEPTLYKSHKHLLTNLKSCKEVINKVSSIFNMYPNSIYFKYKHQHTNLRAVSCLFLSMFCDLRQSDICSVLGNITQARVSQLSNIGFDIVSNNPNIISLFLEN